MLNVQFFKFLLPLALLVTGCQTRQPVTNIIRDLEYATYENQGETKQLLLDLYLPVVEDSEQPQPLLI